MGCHSEPTPFHRDTDEGEDGGEMRMSPKPGRRASTAAAAAMPPPSSLLTLCSGSVAVLLTCCLVVALRGCDWMQGNI